MRFNANRSNALGDMTHRTLRGPIRPRVSRLLPAWSLVPNCRMADGRDRDSELIEIVWES